MYLVDLTAGAATNLTAIDRVSFHNTGLFFWPGDPTKLGFQALIDGNSHPFRMDRDGRNKRDLTKGSQRVRLRLQRLAGRPTDRVPQELPGLRRRRRRLERPPDRDRPPVQLRAPVVARRQAPALRRRRALQLPPVRGQCRRHRPPQARRPGRLSRRDRVPRRPRLPRRQQRHPRLVGRRHVGLLHRQGRRRASSCSASRSTAGANASPRRPTARCTITRRPRRMASAWPTDRGGTASGNSMSCGWRTDRSTASPACRTATAPCGRTGNRRP